MLNIINKTRVFLVSKVFGRVFLQELSCHHFVIIDEESIKVHSVDLSFIVNIKCVGAFLYFLFSGNSIS